MTLASNGKEAVECAQRCAFDVVLMDIQMPIMGGVQATQLIRELEQHANRRTPIVAMTAHAIKADREKYRSAGMDGYVSKPVRTDLLRDEIARVVQFAEIRLRADEIKLSVQ